eukprot:scaffold133471_cov99-Phaeocystis_antarctica.AAC.1
MHLTELVAASLCLCVVKAVAGGGEGAVKHACSSALGCLVQQLEVGELTGKVLSIGHRSRRVLLQARVLRDELLKVLVELSVASRCVGRVVGAPHAAH